MMKTLKTLFFLLLANTVLCQNITDRELAQLAEDLAKAVESKMSGQNIAIADFVDTDDKPSNLGKYLSEEFSYTLVNKAANKFKVIDRTQLRRLMDEAGIGDKGMVDPGSVQKLGRLKGITAVLYGKLVPASSSIKVYVKVVVLETQVNEITVRGELTRTPTIDGFLGLEIISNKVDGSGGKEVGNTSPVSTTSPFTNQNIQIKLVGCTRNGSYVDCELEITSIGKDDNFAIKVDNTRLVDANWNSCYASQVGMGGKQPSSVQGNKALRANSPVPAIVRFANVPSSVKTYPMMELNCNSYSAYIFKAQLKNINIKS